MAPLRRLAGSSPLVENKDLAVLAGMACLAPVSWLLPQKAWPALAHRLSGLSLPLAAPTRATVIPRIEAALGPNLPRGGGGAVLRAVALEQVLAFLQVLRCRRPGGYRPRIELQGLEHVIAARDRGRGVILWVSYFAHCDLIAKMAFHQAGLAVQHLGRRGHGFSESRFGRAWLNPVQTGAELRYLARRVIIPEVRPGAALEELAAALAANGVVSITVHRDAARPLRAPLLESEMILAPGAPKLALDSGAALIPVFPLRIGPDRFLVEFGARLTPARAQSDPLQALARDYARRLAPYVLNYPGQWRGWSHL